MSHDDDLSRQSLLDLFREETQTQTEALSRHLLALEQGAQDAAAFEACMRAAHSLKGAARIVGVPQGVEIAGRMEECFVAAQRGEQVLGASHIDALLTGVDLLVRVGDPGTAASVTPIEIDAFAVALANAGEGGEAGRAAVSAPAAPLSLDELAAQLRLSEPLPDEALAKHDVRLPLEPSLAPLPRGLDEAAMPFESTVPRELAAQL
ncbi:Hpt domain-containing protein, partial [Burkholderia gladioli]|uniref:Hpt domain-containing protein n=1 Tax=Burkholderia gladioli TaxID=28095 RepID=UPI0006273FA0